MSDGLNDVTLIGNLGADPACTTVGDSQVLNLRIACNESYKDRDGVRRDKTEWIDVEMWGPRATALAGMLRKGETIAVKGSIRTRSWDDKEGVKRYKTSVNARDILLFGGNRGGASEPGDTGGGYTRRPGDAPRGGPAPARGAGGYGRNVPASDDDDGPLGKIPF